MCLLLEKNLTTENAPYGRFRIYVFGRLDARPKSRYPDTFFGRL